MKKLIRSFKVRIVPTTQQLEQFQCTAGAARWAYNYFLAYNKSSYEDAKNNGMKPQFMSAYDMNKHICNNLKPTSHTWLRDVSANSVKWSLVNAEKAYKNFFKKTGGYPRFKKKGVAKLSFYVNYESLKRTQHGFRGDKLGLVATTEPLPKLKKGEHYMNPHISFDGKFWFLSASYEIEVQQVNLQPVSLGIDVGIKDLAVCSDGIVYGNINKSRRVRKLKEKLKRAQRKLSRKYECNKKHKKHKKRKLHECKNYQKQKAVVNEIHRKINNIRTNHIHQVSNDIVKTKPCRIVIEDLCVSNMLKNKHLRTRISEQKLAELHHCITYKAEQFNIEVVRADKWFASSKTCSTCGSIKSDLKLSDREYECEHCGLMIDRDYNASLNLANYKNNLKLPNDAREVKPVDYCTSESRGRRPQNQIGRSRKGDCEVASVDACENT